MGDTPCDYIGFKTSKTEPGYPLYSKDIDDIVDGNFKVPEPKKLAPTTAAITPSFVQLKDDEELPF